MDMRRAQSIIRGIYGSAKNEEARVHERATNMCVYVCVCVCACLRGVQASRPVSQGC